jgi:hypothetical protein
MDLELLQNGKKIDVIDFGTPETGSKNRLVLQLRNNSPRWSIMKIECSLKQNDELRIEYPMILRPSEISDVIISWNPKFERREPLLLSETFSGQLIIG